MISQINLSKDVVERGKRLLTGLGLVGGGLYLVIKSQQLDPMSHSVTAAFMLVATGLVMGLTGTALVLRAADNAASQPASNPTT
ncbi:MAG: hypothetical protein ACK4PI_02795 [Tepidisphaerales bacterium]